MIVIRFPNIKLAQILWLIYLKHLPTISFDARAYF